MKFIAKLKLWVNEEQKADEDGISKFGPNVTNAVLEHRGVAILNLNIFNIKSGFGNKKLRPYNKSYSSY